MQRYEKIARYANKIKDFVYFCRQIDRRIYILVHVCVHGRKDEDICLSVYLLFHFHGFKQLRCDEAL